MKKIDLTGTWHLNQKQNEEQIPIEIPGDNHTALYVADKIPDPYKDDNIQNIQWIGTKDWVFTRVFTLTGDILTKKIIELHFDSIDTESAIYVNDQLVGQTNNMFQKYDFDVAQYLRVGKNVIRVEITAPEKTIANYKEKLAYKIPYKKFLSDNYARNLIRKAQFHFGFNYSPRLIVSGIYGDVFLMAYDECRIDYVHTNQKSLDGNRWQIEVATEAIATEDLETTLAISLGEIEHTERVHLTKGKNPLKTILEFDNPKLWWPAGYGQQNLYDLKITLGSDQITKRLGIRTVELVTKRDRFGESFIFRVNGKKIFCKGTNWIPIDALPKWQTIDRYKSLLLDVIEAHMNMIRIPGSSQYEKDIFYQLCDENGILVWQDFMFSQALYPATPDFLTIVEQEVIHQVKRLKDHPCIILWCGDDQVENSLTTFQIAQKNLERYKSDYERLNSHIGYHVERLDPYRPWYPTTPSSGELKFADVLPDIMGGDIHYMDMWQENKDFNAYYTLKPRFVTKVGFPSIPSLSTLKNYISEANSLKLDSKVIKILQKDENRVKNIQNTISRDLMNVDDVSFLQYLSQIEQTRAIKTAIEFWRSTKPRCMGILYWHLNDCWPDISCSSIEYNGQWKLLHYVIKRSFQPMTLATFVKDNKNIEIWGVNDTDTTFLGQLTFTFIDFTGSVQRKYQQQAQLKHNSSKLFTRINKKNFPIQSENGFLLVELKEEEEIIEQDSILLTKPIQCNLVHANIDITTQIQDENTVDITLKTDKPAFYVSLETQKFRGHFSDNGFTLVPQQEKNITFTTKKSIIAEEFENDIQLIYLNRNP